MTISQQCYQYERTEKLILTSNHWKQKEVIIGFPTVIVDKNVRVKKSVDSLSLKTFDNTTYYHLSDLISISYKYQKK